MRLLRSWWGKLPWGAVILVSGAATAVLLIAAVNAYDRTQNFVSCNPRPPVVLTQPGVAYICPSRFTHSWSVHTHGELAAILLAAAIVAALVAGTALVVWDPRRGNPPVPSGG